MTTARNSDAISELEKIYSTGKQPPLSELSRIGSLVEQLLKTLQTERSMSISQVANEMQLHNQTILRWVRHERVPRTQCIKKLIMLVKDPSQASSDKGIIPLVLLQAVAERGKDCRLEELRSAVTALSQLNDLFQGEAPIDVISAFVKNYLDKLASEEVG